MTQLWDVLRISCRKWLADSGQEMSAYGNGRLIAQRTMVHGASLKEALDRAHELLQLVDLDGRAAERYPNEFLGGQRQRIGVARALALRPEVLVADEPASALDVSVQAQVLWLLADIRERFDLTMLFNDARPADRHPGLRQPCSDTSRRDCRVRHDRGYLHACPAALHARAAWCGAGQRLGDPGLRERTIRHDGGTASRGHCPCGPNVTHSRSRCPT